MQPIPNLFRASFAACALVAALQAQAQPNAIPGTSLVPAVWYQSDQGVTNVSGTVSVWVDLSGNGNNVSQGTVANRPTWVAGVLPNGKPTLRFDGTDRLLFTTGLLSQNWTCFAVARPDWDNNQKSFLCGGQGSFQWRVRRNADTSAPGRQSVTRRAEAPLLDGLVVVPSDRFNLFSVRITDGSTDTIDFRFDRAVDRTGSTASANTFTNLTTEVGGFEYLRGDIAAMVVFTNALSNAEVVSVENYLYNWAMKFAPSVISLR